MVWELASWRPAVLLLTERAMLTLGDKARRGTAITISRAGDANAPMEVRIDLENLERTPGLQGELGEPLPDAEDVRAVLLRIWGLPDNGQTERRILPIRREKSG